MDADGLATGTPKGAEVQDVTGRDGLATRCFAQLGQRVLLVHGVVRAHSDETADGHGVVLLVWRHAARGAARRWLGKATPDGGAVAQHRRDTRGAEAAAASAAAAAELAGGVQVGRGRASGRPGSDKAAGVRAAAAARLATERSRLAAGADAKDARLQLVMRAAASDELELC